MSVCFEKVTPYYLLNLSKVINRYEELSSAIEKRNRKDIIAYSIKANYNEEIIRVLNDMGAWFEVCSKKELEYLVSLNIEKNKIIINGNFAFHEMSEYNNDCLMIIDSFMQLEEWLKSGYKQNIGIRININTHLKDDRFINKKSRFGIEVSSLRKLLTDDIREKIKVIQCHLSGNNRDISVYEDIINWIYSEVKALKLDSLQYIDIGGGFKIGYDDRTFSMYVDKISEKCEKLFPNATIIYEPGNSLVNGCMDYYTKIVSEKEIGGSKIKIVDGTVLHLPRMKSDKRKYEVQHDGVKCQEQKVYGITCKESDEILTIKNENELHIGNVVLVKNVGAYCINEVSDFIIDRPRVYIYEENKKGVFLGGHLFQYVCDYSDCRKLNAKSDYSAINKTGLGNKTGLYAFLDKKGKVLYVGVAYNRCVKKRLRQHFSDTDSGSLRYKLKTTSEKKELDECQVFVCDMEKSKKELLIDEAFLIGTYRPKFCYME